MGLLLRTQRNPAAEAKYTAELLDPNVADIKRESSKIILYLMQCILTLYIVYGRKRRVNYTGKEGRKAEKDPEHMAASCSLLGCS